MFGGYARVLVEEFGEWKARAFKSLVVDFSVGAVCIARFILLVFFLLFR